MCKLFKAASVMSLCLGLSGSASATLIDVTGGSAGEGLTLNHVAYAVDLAGGQGGTIQGVPFSTSLPPGITETGPATFFSSGGPALSGSSTAADMALSNLVSDVIYGGVSTDPHVFTITGLVPNAPYIVSFLETLPNRTLSVELNGTLFDKAVTGSFNLMNFQNTVNADPSGKIVADVWAPAAGGDSTALAALVVQAPEPSSFALFGLGVAVMFGFTRRRRYA